jgi:hypothetical protein
MPEQFDRDARIGRRGLLGIAASALLATLNIVVGIITEVDVGRRDWR